MEVAEIELLVRGVRIFVRQADAEEHGRQPEDLLERGDDRDRTAFAVEDRGLAEALLDRAPGRLHERVVEVGHPRLAAVHARHLHLDRLRRNLLEVGLEQLARSCPDPDRARGAC